MMRILCWMERWVLSDTLMLTGSLDDVVEALDEDDGDDVFEDDQDAGCSASTNLKELCLKY